MDIVSEKLQFSTSTMVDSTPPDLLNLNVEVLEDGRARITWYTSESSTEEIILNNQLIFEYEFATKKNHEYITEILAKDTYDLVVKSSDASGNENTSSITFKIDSEGGITQESNNNNQDNEEDNSASAFTSTDIFQIGILVVVLVLLVSLIRVRNSENNDDKWS